MFNEEDKKLFVRAIEKWGWNSQIEMLIEECSEVIQAIQKYKRIPDYDRYFNICEKIADVQIMIAQIETSADYKDLISHVRDLKLLKLRKLLE